MNKLLKRLSLILILSLMCQFALPLSALVEDNNSVVRLEAESVALTSGFKQVASQDASGGYAYNSQVKNIPEQGVPALSEQGALVYTFNIENPGYYTVWVRSKSENTGSDSIWYSSDTTSGYVYKEFAIYEDYLWTRLERAYIYAGNYKVSFLSREANGFSLDEILVTNVGYYIPCGADGKHGISEQKLPKVYASPKVYPPKNEHPRVLLRAGEQTEAVKANLEHPQNIDMYNRVIYYADLNKNGILPSGTNNYSETDLAVSESCAFLYLLNKEANLSYGKKAVTNIKNICNTTVLTTNGFPTRSAGHIIYITALVYDWCYDLLTESDKNELIGYMINLASTMEIGWPAVKQGNFVGHGSESQLLKDLFAAAVAIYDEYPDFYELVGGRLYSEMLPARDFMYEGHYFQVGSGYGPERYTCDMWNAFLLKAIGDTTSYSEDQKYLMYEMIYNRRPDGVKAVHGDYYDVFDGYNRTDLEGFFLASNYYKDEKLKKEYFRINPEGKNFYSSNLSISPVLHLIVNDVNVGAQSFTNLPLTALYEGSNGTMIARSSWDDGKESDGVMVRMNFINKLIGSHQHLDSGSFDIYYKGSLALDSGVYESQQWYHDDGTPEISLNYGSAHDVNYNKLSIAHNVMLVKMPGESLGFPATTENDGGQKGPKGVGAAGNATLNNISDLENDNYNIGTILSRDIGEDLNKPDYSYIKGDITKAYSDAKMEKYIRSFMYLNFFDEDYPAALIVFDDIKSTNENYEKTWLLHTEEEPVVDYTDSAVTVSRTENGYEGSMINKTLLPEKNDIKYTVIGGEGQEFVVNGKNYTAIPERGYEAGKYRVEISTKSKNKQDYYLNVMEIGKDGSKYPSSAELVVNDSDFAGVKVKDRVVFFKKGADKHSAPLTISLENKNESLKYIVTGLKAGQWTITSGGQTVAVKDVSEENDVLSFTGESGTYKLTYSQKATLNKDLFFMNNLSESLGNIPDIKIDKEFKTFENNAIVTESGNILVCAEEYLEKLGITPTKITESRVSYKTELRAVTFEKGKKTYDVNGNRLPLAEAPVTVGGKLYIPPVDAAGAFGTTASFNSTGGVLQVNKNSEAVTSNLKKVNVISNDGGVVTPGGIILATDGAPLQIVATPDTGYYVKTVLYNGEPIGLYSSIGAVTIKTPRVTENSVLEVEFEELKAVGGPIIQSVPYLAKEGLSTYVFGRVSANGYEVKEYGILYSAENSFPEYGGKGVKAVKAEAAHNASGYYGFKIVQPEEDMQYYIRPYAIYDDNRIVCADEVIDVKSGELYDIGTTCENGIITLTDDTYVDSGEPDKNFNRGTFSENSEFNLMHSGGYNPAYGRRAYLEFDISELKGIENGAVLRLYVKNANTEPVIKYMSIFALDNEFDEATLTHNTSEPFGRVLGTVKVEESSSYKAYKFDITDYLREKLEKGEKYVSIGVGINEEWQKQIYPNGISPDNFYLRLRGKTNTDKAQIILY